MTARVIADLPTLVRIDYLPIIGATGFGDSVYLVTFQWHEGEYCLFGRMVWRNLLSVPGGLVRPLRGRKLYRTGILAHPHSTPVTFSVRAPGGFKSGLVFAGFAPGLIVNRQVAEAEHALYDQRGRHASRDGPIPRPPVGLII